MGLSVDHHSTAATDALPAIVVEGNRLLSLDEQTLVENIEHLQERHLGRDLVELVGLKPAEDLRPRLPPNLQSDVHKAPFGSRVPFTVNRSP
jgi:hypothetical protein